MIKAMEMDLSDRKLKILSTLIDAYIESCEPIGSKSAVFEKFNLSSATLRNEMARLEEMGLLYQPHTSAGRVPSNRGYRCYVDMIIGSVLPDEEQVNRINLMTQRFSVRPDKLISQSAHIAAALTNCAAISIHSIPKHGKIIYFECSTIDSRNVAIITVIGKDNIKTCVYTSESDINVNDSTVLNRLLNVHLTGIDISTLTDEIFALIEREIVRYVPSMSGIGNVIRSVIDEITDVEIVVCGESNLLMYPEFYDIEHLRRFYSIVSDRQNLNKMITQPTENIDVSIDPDFFPNSALITTSLAHFDGGKTTLSVVGPMRLNYSKIITDLKYFSDIVSKLILGENED